MSNRLNHIADLLHDQRDNFWRGSNCRTESPSLNAHAAFWIPVVVVASFILAAPVAWLVAPRLQARYDRRRAERERARVGPTDQ